MAGNEYAIEHAGQYNAERVFSRFDDAIAQAQEDSPWQEKFHRDDAARAAREA